MENRGYQNNETIEMEHSKDHKKCIPFSSSSKSPQHIHHHHPQHDNKNGANGGARYYCDIEKCCNTNQEKTDGSWHQLKTTFLVVFLIGFFVWAICYFGLLLGDVI